MKNTCIIFDSESLYLVFCKPSKEPKKSKQAQYDNATKTKLLELIALYVENAQNDENNEKKKYYIDAKEFEKLQIQLAKKNIVFETGNMSTKVLHEESKSNKSNTFFMLNEEQAEEALKLQRAKLIKKQEEEEDEDTDSKSIEDITLYPLTF